MLSRLDWRRVHGVLSHLTLAWLPAYAALNVGCLLLKIDRLRRLTRSTGVAVPFLAAFRMSAESGLLGLVTPGRLGEFVRISHLGACGVPPFVGAAILVAERLTDFGVMLVAAALGFARFFGDVRGPALAGLTIAAVPIAAGVFVVGIRHGIPFALRRLQMGAALAAPRSDFAPLIRATLTVGVPRALVIFVGSALQVVILAQALGTHVAPWDLTLTYALTAVASLLPISLGGLGTRETAYILLMGRIGVGPEEATTLSLLDGFMFPALLSLVYIATAALLPRRSAPR